MKQKLFFFVMVATLSCTVFYSCKKETPAPTVEIFETINDYTVTFNPQVANATSFSWDFGDGSDISTEKNPVHIYESFGDYTVKLTVNGDGGQTIAIKVISIASTSIQDLLTGGANASAGKTWILKQAYTAGDGIGPVQNPPYTIVTPGIDNILGINGLGEEYDNEYTFHFDGSYEVNAKNGKVLAAAVYSSIGGIVSGDIAWDISLCAATWNAPASAIWALNSSDLEIDAVGDPNDTNVPPAQSTITITGKTWISLSGGAFFGILDFPSTTQFIVDEINANKLTVSLFVCGYSGDGGDPMYNRMPSNLYHMTFIPK